MSHSPLPKALPIKYSKYWKIINSKRWDSVPVPLSQKELKVSYMTREWYWFDYGLVVLRLLWFVTNLIIIFSTVDLPINELWVVIIFSFSYLIPQCFHLPNRISSFGFIISELFITGSLFVWLSNISLYVIDFMWIPILSITFLSTQKTQWLVLVGFILMPQLIYIFGNFSFELLIPYIVAIVLFGIIGLAFRFLLQKSEEQKLLLNTLHTQNEQLQHLTSEIEYLTLKEERIRIAQDLHDAVGHAMTTTIVSLDAITRLIDKNPEAAKEQTQELSTFARDSLEDLRKYVHALPLHEEHFIDFALQKVIHSFQKTTGIEISFESDQPPVPKELTILLTRCLQEALTNAVKHGHATRISVILGHHLEMLTLTIQDNGSGMENITLGFGLTSMKNRIEKLGGLFHIYSSHAGTIIELKVHI